MTVLARMKQGASRLRELGGRARPIVLMYHRVETLEFDPWQLAVTPDRFLRQVTLLKSRRRIVPLTWLVRELQAGRVPWSSVALTFDDGYVDVLRNAHPILEAEDAPATFYLATGALGSRQGFWWDRLVRILLSAPSLPPELKMTLHERDDVIALRGEDGSSREAFLFEIHRRLRPERDALRQEWVSRIAEWAGVDDVTPDRDRAMTFDEAETLASSGVVDIGPHTVTHPSLPALSKEEMEQEIGESLRVCRAVTGKPVTSFAYPFGDHDATARQVVREAGLHHACATHPGVLTKEADLFALPRLLAANWDEATFEREVLGYA